MVEGTLEITISNQSIHVSVITVSGAGSATTIATERGTLQMSVHVDPHDAADQTVEWSVIDGTGSATISATGLLSALNNGTVTVRATAADGSLVYGDLEITITNQAALASIPDSRDFSLRDVCTVVVPTLDTLRNCFWDADATLFDPTHVAGFDPRYEGDHDRLSNFRNYPVIDYSTSEDDFGALYNWHAIAGGNTAMTYGALYNWYAATKAKQTYKNDYGALYNWYAATYSTGGASIAPDGWHVPSNAELLTLVNTLGGAPVAGDALKETGEVFWEVGNTGTNTSGFTALGSGYRDETGNFGNIRISIFLHSTENYVFGGDGGLVLLYINSWALPVSFGDNPTLAKKLGGVVRLIKDDSTDPGTVTDIDGNIYLTVKIGTQVWMAENLKVEHYNDGTAIPIITDNATWAADTDGAMCYYDNSVESDVQIIAPVGWHVPTNVEMVTLRIYLDPLVDGYDPAGNIAGGRMKSTIVTDWDIPNVGATNDTGFNGVGSGIRDNATGAFVSLDSICMMWAGQTTYPTYGGAAALMSQNAELYVSIYTYAEKKLGASIRLIKDDSTDPGTLTDIDGNVYPTIKIGTQVWMAENLKVTHYNDGTAIPLITDDTDWANDTVGAMCFYENGTPTYTSKPLAPTGWHVPTITEWNTLITFLGGEDIAGGYLKEEGTDHWNLPNNYATDDYGFSAYGGGWREFQGNFGNIKDFGFFWSSTDFDGLNAHRVFMDTWDAFLIATNSIYTMGFSVRCIKDDDTDPGTVTDIDGNVYNTIKIDDQVWMASNFKAIHYNDGTDILNLTDNGDWAADTAGAYCWYNNTP